MSSLLAYEAEEKDYDAPEQPEQRQVSCALADEAEKEEAAGCSGAPAQVKKEAECRHASEKEAECRHAPEKEPVECPDRHSPEEEAVEEAVEEAECPDTPEEEAVEEAECPDSPEEEAVEEAECPNLPEEEEEEAEASSLEG